MVIAENGNSTVVFTQGDEPIHPLLRAAKHGEVKQVRGDIKVCQNR